MSLVLSNLSGPVVHAIIGVPERQWFRTSLAPHSYMATNVQLQCKIPVVS